MDINCSFDTSNKELSNCFRIRIRENDKIKISNMNKIKGKRNRNMFHKRRIIRLML